MGTSKSGRYLNTGGTGLSVSDFALVHSDEGKYTKPSRKGERLRLVCGGHGQTGMNQLDKYGIKYNILKTYPNGVRIGNIPDHKSGRKRDGIGQSWFPESWTPKDIRRAGEHVAGLKRNKHAKDGEKMSGFYKGVRVIAIKTNGKIATVLPDNTQPTRSKK